MRPSAIPLSCCVSPAKVLHDLKLQWMFMVVRMMPVRTADAGLHPMLLLLLLPLLLPPAAAPAAHAAAHAAAAAAAAAVL